MKRPAATPYMATTSTTPAPPVKAEHDSTPSRPQPNPRPSKTTIAVKQEPQELVIATNLPQETSENQKSNQQEPHFRETVTELRNLSASLTSFLRRYDELDAHLGFIRSKIPEHILNPVPLLPQPSPISPVTETLNPDPLPMHHSPIDPVTETLDSPAMEATVAKSTNSEPTVDNSETCLSEIESFCKSMSSRGLYNYIVSHIQEVSNLREEALAALKLSPNPVKLMLECLAYGKDSLRVEEREASVLVLEFLPLMGYSGNEIEAAVKEEAGALAVDNTQSCLSELESVCKFMSSRGLYNYIVSHILEVSKLREGVPAALKLGPNPAKLVLECLAYGKESRRVEEREASVLVLEFLLLMGCNCDDIEAAVKEEAAALAVEWRNQVFNDGGGVKKGSGFDARVLLLLISCFGIPSAFKDEDVRDLVHASNSKEISESLRRSDVLLARIPGIVEEMMKKQMVVKAVDIVCTFGLESKFHPRLCLQHFLQESRKTWMEEVKIACSNDARNKANRKYLTDLKPALEFLEDFKIDPLFTGVISDEISKLEKDITLLDINIRKKLDKKIRKMVKRKRKADEAESSKNLTSQEAKRPQLSHNTHTDGKSSSEGLIPTNLLNGGIRGHNNSFSAFPSKLHVVPTGPYPWLGAHGGMLVDSLGQVVNNNGQPYGWHGNAPFGERLIGPSYAEPVPSMGGHVGGIMPIDNTGQINNNCIQPYGWHGIAPPLRERVLSHNYPEPAPVGVNGTLFKVAPSREGFVGLLNPSSTDTSKQRLDSDLYGFVDTIT